MTRKYNFSAGPAVLPLSVIEELQVALPDLHGSGIGLMEISHRSKTFDDIVRSAMARLRRVLGVPDDHEVLLLQGGASLQFVMVAQNILRGRTADYLDTGAWTGKSIVQAGYHGTARTAFSGKADKYRRLPESGDWERDPNALYTYYCTNNTIYGTQFRGPPVPDGPLVCDMSSDIASRPINAAQHDVIFAGAQKNLGPSGVTVVILSPWAMEQAAQATGVPDMLSYGVHLSKGSLFNTPNTLGIFVLERVLAWIEHQGADTVAAVNRDKAQKLYDLLDSSDFWRPHAARECRSDMNITWRLANQNLEPVMVEQALAANISGIKGHRSVGGLRASLYNACPVASVQALVDFMVDFERRLG
jgi:phosphoserine aminotransferase